MFVRPTSEDPANTLAFSPLPLNSHSTRKKCAMPSGGLRTSPKPFEKAANQHLCLVTPRFQPNLCLLRLAYMMDQVTCRIHMLTMSWRGRIQRLCLSRSLMTDPFPTNILRSVLTHLSKYPPSLPQSRSVALPLVTPPQLDHLHHLSPPSPRPLSHVVIEQIQRRRPRRPLAPHPLWGRDEDATFRSAAHL